MARNAEIKQSEVVFDQEQTLSADKKDLGTEISGKGKGRWFKRFSWRGVIKISFVSVGYSLGCGTGYVAGSTILRLSSGIPLNEVLSAPFQLPDLDAAPFGLFTLASIGIGLFVGAPLGKRLAERLNL
ncbi:MAG: hypothetical protein V1808_02605 [Candidatus Daviesbacteria bacterium]